MTDGRAPRRTFRTQSAPCLPQAGQAVFPVDEMIQRTQQKNGVRRTVRVRQMTRVSNRRRCQRMLRLSR